MNDGYRDGDAPASSGTYVLALRLRGPDPAPVEFGAAGVRRLVPGRYGYVGSAFGPGGFSRLRRHQEVADGQRDVHHWHVDYLLGHPRVEFEDAVRLPGVDRECELARRLPGERIPGIGASDCSCETHVLRLPDGLSISEELGVSADGSDAGSGS